MGCHYSTVLASNVYRRDPSSLQDLGRINARHLFIARVPNVAFKRGRHLFVNYSVNAFRVYCCRCDLFKRATLRIVVHISHFETSCGETVSRQWKETFAS